METHKAFATCASQYSWNKVIENHLNAKEIWSRHGIQAWTSVSCFDHSCTEVLGNLSSPLSLKRTWIYALVISNGRTAGTWLLLKPWQFSPPSAMFYFILPYLPLPLYCISNAAHFPHTKGTMQKLKTMYICPTIPLPCQGVWCVIKTHWYIILIWRELTCSRKLMLEI